MEMKALYSVNVQGYTPLLMHAVDERIFDALAAGETVVQPRPKDPVEIEEVCEAAIYRNAEGEIGLPTRMLWAALCEAGALVKYDAKRNISTRNGTLLPQLLTIGPDFLVFETEPVWRPDWRIVNRRTGPRRSEHLRIWRPKFETWGFKVDVEVFEREIDLARVKLLFALAGSRCGLGAFRAGFNGPIAHKQSEDPTPRVVRGHFGKFKTSGWNLRLAAA